MVYEISWTIDEPEIHISKRFCTEISRREGALAEHEKSRIIWSGHMKYRMALRRFDQGRVEDILRYSEERYIDTMTHRSIAVGKHDDRLVMIPYEIGRNEITPITIHATTRRQINVRLKTGRFRNE